MCETDGHCRTILERQFPGVPVIPDVHEIDEGTPRVDIITGGYPCQPFSVAGKRQGEDDPRHLWPEFLRVIRLLRPRYAFLENVSGHVALGFDRVLADLAEAGFDAEWVVVRASDVGAPHRRERLFCLAADTGGEGREGVGKQPGTGSRGVTPDGDREPSEPEGRPDRAPAADADRGRRKQRDTGIRRVLVASENGAQPAERETAWGVYEPAIRRWEATLGRPAPRPTDIRGRLSPVFVEWMMGLPYGWTEGVSRTARLRMLGNAVVPQQAEHAVRVLTEQQEALA